MGIVPKGKRKIRMIYDFKREKDLRELQKTNDYPGASTSGCDP